MTPKTQDNLRAAWFGPLSADRVARKYHQSGARRVQEFWQAERVAGRLPAGPRPHFQHCTPAPLSATERAAGMAFDAAAALLADAAAVDADADLDLDREIASAEAALLVSDPRSMTAVHGCRIPDSDPLLAALQHHHGDDPRRRLDALFFRDDALTEPNAVRLRGRRRFIDAAMRAVACNPKRYEAAFR